MNNIPAVVVCDAATASLAIAGLTVLDRLLVTAHRAGCAPIILVCGNPPPRLERATAIGMPISQVETAPALPEPTLEISGSVLVTQQDLERLISGGGQLIARDGKPLPVRINTRDRSALRADGIAMSIRDAHSAREAERRFWDSLGSTADGIVDRYFNRPLGRVLSKKLVRTSISPNQVSIASILIGVASAGFFAAGEFVAGAIILQLCAIIDCVDGDLARALFKQSNVGKWLDIGGDQVVHFSVFAAIGVGVARTDASVPAIALGASAAIGVALCFPVIIRALRIPVSERGPLLRVLMDATANRDFSVLLLVLALIGRMDLFLWMAGIGVHVFWIALLALQRGHRARRKTG